jgi:hypothetical protein
MSESKEVWLLSGPGPQPPFAEVAHHLWGEIDFDSDGNSERPADVNWTELTLTRRPKYDQRVDIDPISEVPLVLKIASETPGLARRAAEFLARSCGGTLKR